MDLFSHLHAVEQKLQVQFQNKKLLALALTHRSFWNEHQDIVSEHNERLEFLGDSVLGLLVAEYLYVTYPNLDEGALSDLRSQLVDAPACAAYVMALEVDQAVLLGKGEMMNSGKGRESILADLFEALVGAIFLDQGLEKTRRFLLFYFEKKIQQVVAMPLRNWKAELQDCAQKNFHQAPDYRVLKETGPAHQRLFRVGVWIDEELWGEGEGLSKKEAQMQAAKNALTSKEGNV